MIAEVKRRADIGEVIGRSVKLKRVGRNLVGLCPFHTEKSPSFNVRPDDGFFYCFGCKAAGDVVEFLVRTTGRGFLDVITDLAAQTGVDIPKVALDPEEEARQKEKKRVLRALELAQMFFRTRLSSEAGQGARAYLAELRKIDEDTADRFGLGWGGAADDGLVTFLKEQGVAVDDGVAAGVLGRSERGPYDFFRHRVTIPIRGARGEVVSFQGRIFGERAVDGQGRKRPKYVNGPQTAVYDKSAVLYGLFEAQPALKQGKPAVLVEGPLDAIAVHRAGLPSAVAPCGTGLTTRHVDELRRRTERVVLCMDQDAAGKEAASRALLMMLQAGLDVGLASLPDKDPDAMVAAGRAEELKGLLTGAPAALDALVARARVAATGGVRARVAALDALLPFLAAPQRELVRVEAVRAAARAFSEDEAVIAAEVDKRGRRLLAERVRGSGSAKAARAPSAPPPTAAKPQPAAVSAVARVAAPRSPPSPPFSEPEVLLVEALLMHPQLAARCGVLAPALKNAELRSFMERLVELLVRFHDEDPRAVLARVPLSPNGRVRGVLLTVQQAGGFSRPDAYLSEATAARVVEDAILSLDRRTLELRLGELQARMAEADAAADHGERKRLLAEQAALVEAVRALGSGREPPTARPVLQVAGVATVAADRGAPPSPGSEVAPSGELAESMDDGPLDPPEPPWAGEPDDDPFAV
ncbi:MAG: DNA primase [Deltaproteobacteria bacterium]|nr:DNA primase [Deltaproteobacteria bacterium]